MTDLQTRLRDGLDGLARQVPVPEDGWADYRARRKPQRVRRHAALAVSVAAIAAATAGIVVGAMAFSSSTTTTVGDLVLPPRSVTLVPTHQLSAQQLHGSAAVLAHRLSADRLPARVRVIAGERLEVVLTSPIGSVGAVEAVARTRGVLRFRQALSLVGPSSPGSAGNRTARLAVSPTLTPAFERSYANWDCAKQRNPSHGDDPASDYLIACSTDGTSKYLLAPAAVEGTQVSSATANLDAQSGTQWVVDLSFTRSGSSAWREVTKKAYNVNRGQPNVSCSPPTGCNSVAIVLDGVVQSAPYISQAGGISGGRAQISGDFTRRSADDLANVLKYGALPATFTVAR